MENGNKTDWLYRELRRRIALMRDGEAFPTVRELIAEYDLSQATVTAAVKRLKEKGLISSGQPVVIQGDSLQGELLADSIIFMRVE